MYAQDGYSEETIVEAATLAARFYHNGNTVKEIAAYLRRVRKVKKLGCLMYFGNRFRKGIISDRLKSRSFII